jgi:signal transduction histidine kinase/CheY-like chemotaxis protein
MFGVLSVGVPAAFDESKEERSLLHEVAGDIAFALSSIEREEALDRARRALRVLSASNHAVMRATNETGLLAEACRILVEDGGYRFAWVGLAGDDEAKTVEPIAVAGFEDGYLETITVTWSESEHGGGPAGTAIRTGEPFVARSIATDPAFRPWRDQAVQRGYGSCVGLPLVVGERTIGALTIFASEQDAFDHDELRLLGELAVDLGFGISTLRQRSERDNLTKQLLHAQRMEALGRLAGGVAHDFNNLLSVIISFTRFAYDELSEDDTRRDDLRQVLSAADRANRLTRQLLAFSQTRKVEPSHLDLNEAVLQLDKMLRRTLGENIELVSLADEKLWTTLIDPGQLDQVLLNLAVNARDAMPNGGTLTVETRNVVKESRTAELDPGDYVMLKVTDTGSGMNDEVAAKAFEPFFTTKGVKGTGLGLSTCFGIIKQAGGSITAQSNPEQGTTITVLLPRVDAGPAVPEKVHERAPDVSPGEGVVFVVEDQPVVLSAVGRILRTAGFVVLEATSAEEALASIERLSTNVRLVISDVVLPNMSGYDLIAKLRSRRPGVRTLLMSGYLGDDRPSRAIMEDGVPFLPKPFTPESLLRAVHDVLGT